MVTHTIQRTRQRALHKHSVISFAIAKGVALRERGKVRTSGGSIKPCGQWHCL
jgi:hypothetical protein